MANQEQLIKLKQSVENWNSWRKSHPGVKINLRGANLKGLDLSGADFSKVDIRSANFSGSKLKGANFAGAKCGLQKRWAFFLTIFPLLLSSLSGLASAFSISMMLMIFDNSQIPESKAASLACLVVSVACLIVTIRKSMIAGLALGGVTYLAVVSVGFIIAAIEGVVGNPISKIITEAVTGTIVGNMTIVALILGGSVSLSLAASVLGTLTLTLTIVVAVASAALMLTSIVLMNSVAKTGATILITFILFVILIFLASILIGVFPAYISWRAMRGDKEDAWLRSFSIAYAAIGGTAFNGTDLTKANFIGAKLKSTDFRKATLTGVRWYGSKMLNRVRHGNTYLKYAHVRQWLVGKGTDKYFDGKDLRGINLQGANLTDASFIGTDLSRANLGNADLSRAKLILTQLNETDLTGATLTGACIEGWNINSQTCLDKVICYYVFLKEGSQERRPSLLEKDFESGDFAKLVQKALSTVDLIFSDGIDWETFLDSFQKIQVEDGNGELSIQAIERKTGGAFVVRVEVPPDANKAEIEASFWEKYNPLLEAKDREIKLLSQQTEFYSQQVEVIRTDNTRLIGIVETMVEKETIKVQQNFNAPVTGVAGNVEGNQNIFTSQSIAEASTEIQTLLTTLQNNGLTQEQTEGIVANNLATQAKSNPTFKDKLVNWGKSLGNKAAETSISEVVRRVIKLALNLAGVPFP